MLLLGIKSWPEFLQEIFSPASVWKIIFLKKKEIANCKILFDERKSVIRFQKQ